MNNVFLHENLLEEVYIKAPLGLVLPSSNEVCKLNKSLYGLKKVCRQWHAKLTEVLCSSIYVYSMYDNSLFYKKEGGSLIYMAIYVDNTVMIKNDLAQIEELQKFLHRKFKIKDLGNLYYFPELEVRHTPDDGLIISKRKFVLDLLKEHDC